MLEPFSFSIALNMRFDFIIFKIISTRFVYAADYSPDYDLSSSFIGNTITISIVLSIFRRNK